MGIRINRIPAHLLPEKVSEIEGKTVQVIMWGGETRMGKVRLITSEHVEINDLNRMWYNRKRHTHQIPISEIREVLIDRQSAW